MTRFRHRRRAQLQDDPAALRAEQQRFAQQILSERAKFAQNDPSLLRWAETVLPADPFPAQKTLEFANRED